MELLNLSPYNTHGAFVEEIHTISQTEIEPIHMICPISMSCTNIMCRPFHFALATYDCDIPKVKLIKHSSILAWSYVLTGECKQCHTLYSADQKSYQETESNRKEIFLNSARYLKIGTHLWVDCIFSNAVINGVYSFYASPNAYTQYWNNSFGLLDSFHTTKLNRKHIWQIFIQESICTIAETQYFTMPHRFLQEFSHSSRIRWNGTGICRNPQE